MLQIDKATLGLDLERGFSGLETALDRSHQEEADELARCGHHLLAGHDSLTADGFKSGRTRYGVVVGEKDRGQAQPAAPCGDEFGLAPAVGRSRAVNMQIDPDQGRSEVNPNPGEPWSIDARIGMTAWS